MGSERIFRTGRISVRTRIYSMDSKKGLRKDWYEKMNFMTMLFVVWLLLLIVFSGSLLYMAKRHRTHAAERDAAQEKASVSNLSAARMIQTEPDVPSPEEETASAHLENREAESEENTGACIESVSEEEIPEDTETAPEENDSEDAESASGKVTSEEGAVTAADEIPEYETESFADAVPEPDVPSAVQNPPVRKKAVPAFLFELFVDVFTILFLVTGLIDFLNIMDFAQYEGAFAICGVTAVLEYLIYMFSQKRICKTVHFFGKLLLAAAVLELTVFQFPSYEVMLSGNQPETTIQLSDARIEQGTPEMHTEDGLTVISGTEEVIFTFEQLEQPVNSINVAFKMDKNTSKVHFVVDITDDTTDSYRYNIVDTTLIRDNEMSGSIACQFSGNVHNMRLKFSCYDENHSVMIQSVTLNAPIPFEISFVRFLLILVLGTFAYAIVCSPVLRRSYENARIASRIGSIAITCVMRALACAMVFKELPIEKLGDQFKLTYGNQITQELVDAFENKQLNLMFEPSEELLAMENPYDRTTRDNTGVGVAWDHVLYEGKYYSYYGIAPVLLLFLPYHLITGYYCSTNLAVLLFGLIGIVFLGLTYMAIVKRWFRKVPVGCVLAGLVILFSVCGVWYSLGRTLFYEISISSGFAFVAMGAYCLISSNVVSSGKTSLIRILLASLFSGLAVLCRPTLAVYSVCTCLFFLFGFRKSGQKMGADGTCSICPTRRIGYILCAVLPLAALGAFQMWYNYARFDSPFDFGIQYSLTINDFTHAEYHTHFVLIGLFNYLFAAPSITPQYPFITTPFYRLNVNGYYFSDAGNTSGIVFLAFPVIAYLLAGRAMRKLDGRRQRVQWGLLIGMTCVLMPLVILFSIWESGYAVRYVADFSWQIVIGALAILFFLYQKSQNETKKNFVHGFLSISMLAAIVINGVQIFNFALPEGDYPTLVRAFDQMIAFWK